MIIIETKLKNIPETCTKCKFSEMAPVYDNWGVFQGEHKRICNITNKEVPYVYIKERKNWCYTKCKTCPLREI